MDDFKRILVGLELTKDGKGVTEGSIKAARQAIWVGSANQGSIHFLHSTYNDRLADPVEEAEHMAKGGLRAESVDALEAVVEEAGAAGVEASLEVSADRVWLDVCRRALRSEADLVVVGKRDEAGDEQRKLGNVAIKLMRKCPCAVWVVKPEHDLVHRLVLGATDLSEVGDRATRYAAGVARRQACELHIAHAYQVPFGLTHEAGRISEEEFAERLEALRTRALEAIRAGLGPCLDEGPEPAIHIGKGAPATVIKEAVAHLHPDLLVMGSVSRGGIAGMLFGSTAERLLPEVSCSILTIKPVDFVSPVTLH